MTHTTATYAGLDVSLKETAICSIDETGKVLFEGKVATATEPDREVNGMIPVSWDKRNSVVAMRTRHNPGDAREEFDDD